MGVAELALELLYIRNVLEHLGHVFEADDVLVETKRPEVHRLIHAAGDSVRQGDIAHGPTWVGTDNKGAYDLCHRTTVGRNSRHIERRGFKMRELRATGVVRLELVRTDDMDADMFTKPLRDEVFARHRATVMNLFDSEGRAHVASQLGPKDSAASVRGGVASDERARDGEACAAGCP